MGLQSLNCQDLTPHPNPPPLGEGDLSNFLYRLPVTNIQRSNHIMTTRKKGKIGSSFETFLKEENLYDDVSAQAIKRVIAWQIEQGMTDLGLTKSNMATQMKTSRSQLDRLLDPDNEKIQLDTLHRAATILGKRLMISLEERV